MLDENQVREDTQVRILTDDMNEEYGWISEPNPDGGSSADVLVEMRESGEEHMFRKRELEKTTF